MYQQSDLLFRFIDRHPKYLGKETRYYHGLVLLKLGRNNEAREILKKAIREQEQRRLKKPEKPEVYRHAGKILHVLDRTIDAKKAYLQALKLDQERLKVAIDHEKEAIYRWSLGKTLFAIGEEEAADEQFQQAAKITRLNKMKKKILRWIDEERNVLRLLPSEMASIDIDLTRIPEEQYPKDSENPANASNGEKPAFLWVNEI
jgi:tetratricopeptide (TPR) repeat protein